MKNIKIMLMLLCGALMGFTSCSDKDEPESIPTNALYDFATLVRTDTGGSVFQVQKSQNSPVVTYTAAGVKPDADKVAVGDRLIICYTPKDGAQAYTDCEIKLYGYIILNNTSQQLLSGTAEEYNDWESTIFRPVAIWETGKYLNLQVEAAMLVALKPKKFVLVVDAATVNDEYPVMHLIAEVPKENFGANMVLMYASFDISSVWSHPSCKGVKLVFPGLDGEETMTINKE